MLETVSLFSGCGGLDLGFMQAGFNIIWANDNDKHAVKAYQENFGNHIQFGNITDINPKDIPKHKVLIGGFPCQPFSMMGGKLGFTDTRGTLFFNIEKILEEHSPDIVVLENVRHLKTHDNGNTFKVIKEVLEKKLNYKVYAKVLNSSDFGVPQTRNRIFIVCFKDHSIDFSFPDPILLTSTMQDLLDKDVDVKYYLSQKIKKTILAEGTKNYKAKPEIDLKIARPLCATMHKMHRASQDNYVTQPSEVALQAGKTPIRRLTPLECARLQGFPIDNNKYQIVVSDTQAYRQFGNAVTVSVANHVAQSIIKAINTGTENKEHNEEKIKDVVPI
ncbi:DNA cytosine methyltransferase [Lentibacillus sp. Marseille-P4043]|uniref:DNA cytosine methyltransferase n=1 Tax=Lentibacillus sp. Marseille-P4043 TaxID=2040293 RepID=UPI000D0BCCA5|nr:DNA (cytosine-5-)-methyltransferase [Lentibacillus sp. Marseille-P4043]